MEEGRWAVPRGGAGRSRGCGEGRWRVGGVEGAGEDLPPRRKSLHHGGAWRNCRGRGAPLSGDRGRGWGAARAAHTWASRFSDRSPSTGGAGQGSTPLLSDITHCISLFEQKHCLPDIKVKSQYTKKFQSQRLTLNFKMQRLTWPPSAPPALPPRSSSSSSSSTARPSWAPALCKYTLAATFSQ